MGMPSVNVSFSEVAATAVARGDRGIIAMILRDTVPDTNPIVISSVTDIPTTLSTANQEQISLSFIGYTNPPKKIVAYVISSDAENYTEALNYLETVKFNYLVIPTVSTDNQTETVVSWIKEQRTNKKYVKAILPNTSGDTEGIINYATASVTDGTNTYTAEQYCSRIAGIIAGTPLYMACTYAPLTELTDCTRLTRAEMDEAVDAGKFIVFHDGEKVKVGRGVNSFVTTTSTKNDQFKKIKIVDAMDMINDDICSTAEDSYIGKYAASYANKCLLISAISNYLESLKGDGVLSEYTIGIDTEANKSYLDGKGTDTSDMTEDELKQADTGDKVYLTATLKILDAIEEIVLPISI